MSYSLISYGLGGLHVYDCVVLNMQMDQKGCQYHHLATHPPPYAYAVVRVRRVSRGMTKLTSFLVHFQDKKGISVDTRILHPLVINSKNP